MKDATGKMTNPAAIGEIFGKPSFGTGLVTMESGKFLGFATITETSGDRLELGYGYDACTSMTCQTISGRQPAWISAMIRQKMRFLLFYGKL